MGNLAAILPNNQKLVRKSLGGGVLFAPEDALVVTRSNLFLSTDHSLVATAPTGYSSAGYLSDEGVRNGRTQETEDITAWQSRTPVRSEQTSDTETIAVDLLETKKLSLEIYNGVDLSAVTSVNGAISFQKPDLPTDKYYRCITFSVDIVNGLEYVEATFWPRVKVTDRGEKTRGKGGANVYPITLTAFTDTALGYSKDEMHGGKGFAAVATEMGFTVTPPA